MKFYSFIRNKAASENGFTLIEILASVTLISVISISFAGYFMTAIEQSASLNHRIIASNLARLKMTELRAYFKEGSHYDQMSEVLRSSNDYYLITSDKVTSNRSNVTDEQQVEALFRLSEPDHLLRDMVPVGSSNQTMRSTTYQYQVTIHSNERIHSLEDPVRMPNGNDYLLNMEITVDWSGSISESQSLGKRVILDTYLVRRIP